YVCISNSEGATVGSPESICGISGKELFKRIDDEIVTDECDVNIPIHDAIVSDINNSLCEISEGIIDVVASDKCEDNKDGIALIVDNVFSCYVNDLFTVMVDNIVFNNK
ncbi:unnamed protein product, partial [Gordionus sp. m RMFG-2023]